MAKKCFKLKKYNTDKYKITFTNTGINNGISINISSWCSIKEELEIDNIEKQLQQLQFQLKQFLYQFTSNNIFFKNQYIVDVDAAVSGLIRNNLTFLQVDLILFGTPTEKCKSDLLEMLKQKLDTSTVFNFQKKKK